MKKLSLLLVLLLLILDVYSQEREGFLIYKTDSKIINDVCFTKKGEAICIADNNVIKVFKTGSGELLNEFRNGHRGQILTIDISKDSTLLVSGGKDNTIVIWDFVNNKILKSLSFHKGIVTSVEISANGRYLVSGGTDNKIFLYDLQKGNIIKEFSDHTGIITRVTFSKDGKYFAACGGDKKITLYNTEEAREIADLSCLKSWVRDVSFTADGSKLLSCGDNSLVTTWDLTDFSRIIKVSETKYSHNWILCLDTSYDNNSFSTGGVNGTVKIVWLHGIYRGRLGVPVNRILFKPDENSLVKIAIATRGKGAMLIDGSGLKNTGE